MDVLGGACLALLAPSGVVLLVADRLPRPGPLRARVYPVAVVVLALTCIFLTGLAAVRYDPAAAVTLAVAATFLGLAGRRRHAARVQQRDRLLRQLRVDRPRRRQH